MPAEARVDIRLAPELKEALRVAASVRRVSMSEAIREPLEAFITATANGLNDERAVPGRPAAQSDPPARPQRKGGLCPRITTH
jgi:hypothetical protein